jgi:perosamine synthetase
MTTTTQPAISAEVPLSRPDITDLERQAVLRVMESPVLSIGPELERFESMLAECAGVAHAKAVNSGTSALHIAALALGIGPGDEVITTPFSFIASANCILFAGATPVFADIDPMTLCIDSDDVERRITDRTKAVLAVDVFGHPADWERLEAVAERHGLGLIEDSAESIGSGYRGRKAGSFGDAAVFAFYPNKQMTTGEGGALLTDRDDVAELAQSLRNQGRSAGSAWLAHARLGFNYRLSEINAALGCAQVQRLPELISNRSRVARRYNELLGEFPEIETQHVAPGVDMSWFVYVVRLTAGYTRSQRDALLKTLRQRGIGCSNYFPCIHLEPIYREMLGYGPGDFPVAEDISDRSIALPFFGRMTDEQQVRVVGELREAIAHL